MAKLNSWLTIDRLNGEGNARVTLTASELTGLIDRSASLRIKTPTKTTIITLNQTAYEPLIPENIPDNQVWIKTTDNSVISFTLNQNLIATDKRTDGWVVYTFDGTVTEIPYGAFSNKTTLSEIVLPKALTSIGDSAFNNCYRLSSIDIPDSVVSIGKKAFYNCDGLLSITIGSGVASIGDYAFLVDDGRYCNVDSISVSSDNAYYDSRENCGCLIETSSNSIIKGSANSFIPEGITNIGFFAFYDVSMTSIDIPNSVHTIEGYAFKKTGLVDITIGSGVTSIGYSAFESCSYLNSITCYARTAPTLYTDVFRFVKEKGTLYYPSGSYGYTTWLSNSIGYLGYHKWVGEEMEVLENNKIYYTSTDGNVVTPNKTDGFGANIVSNTYENGIGVIEFDGDVTSIGYMAFNYCRGLQTITIPNSVKVIDSYGFYYCTALSSVNIPDSVTSIGSNAFNNCTSFTSLTVPDTVKTIGTLAFFGCRNLSEFKGGLASSDGRCLILNNKMVAFAPYGLLQYTVPNGVTSIADSVFRDTYLTSVTLPQGLTSIGNAEFYRCKSLVEVNIPDTVTSIGIEAFGDCILLETLDIQGSVTSLGDYMFYNCESLKSVTLPSTLTSIGGYSFQNCSSLTSITCKASVAPTIADRNVFSNVKSGGTLYYPSGSDYSTWLSRSSYYLGYYGWQGSPY